MALISGKEVSQKVKDEIKSQTKLLKDKGISVKLAVIIVGDDPASHIYVKNKTKHIPQKHHHQKSQVSKIDISFCHYRISRSIIQTHSIL